MRTRTLGVVAMTCALAVSGCDRTTALTSPDGVSFGPTVVALIGPVTAAGAPFVVFTNGTTAVQSCQFVISASQSVDLQQMTIHMIDGSNLGGPMITVPSTALTNQFGTTRVLAGTSRIFSIGLLSSPLPARSLGASVDFIDGHGFNQRVAAAGACP